MTAVQATVSVFLVRASSQNSGSQRCLRFVVLYSWRKWEDPLLGEGTVPRSTHKLVKIVREMTEFLITMTLRWAFLPAPCLMLSRKTNIILLERSTRTKKFWSPARGS